MGTGGTQEVSDRYPDPPLDAGQILEAARALGPLIDEHVPAIRELGRLPQPLVEGLRGAGVWRVAFPAVWGGPEMPLPDQVALIEDLARHDASVAWTSMILLDSGFFAGNFPFEIAREVYPSMDMGTAVSQYPLGRAERDGDHYRLTGRFKFGSGSYHAEVFGCPCHIYVDGEPQLQANGQPEQALFFAPAESVTVYDCWDTVGLQGTGSTDYSVDDLAVPARHQFTFSETEIVEGLPPLSRHHRFIVLSQYGVLLGLTRHILDELRATVETRVATTTRQPVKYDYAIQVGVPEAEAMWGAARSYVMEYAHQTDDLVFNDRPISREHAAKISMVGPAMASLCRMAVDIALELVGTDAIQAKRPWDHLFQDFRTGAAHVVHRRPNYRKALADLED